MELYSILIITFFLVSDEGMQVKSCGSGGELPDMLMQEVQKIPSLCAPQYLIFGLLETCLSNYLLYPHSSNNFATHWDYTLV